MWLGFCRGCPRLLASQRGLGTPVMGLVVLGQRGLCRDPGPTPVTSLSESLAAGPQGDQAPGATKTAPLHQTPTHTPFTVLWLLCCERGDRGPLLGWAFPVPVPSKVCAAVLLTHPLPTLVPRSRVRQGQYGRSAQLSSCSPWGASRHPSSPTSC